MSETVFPLVSIDSGSVFSSNRFGAVIGADVDRDDFIYKRSEATEAIGEHTFVVTEDYTETQRRWLVWL